MDRFEQSYEPILKAKSLVKLLTVLNLGKGYKDRVLTDACTIGLDDVPITFMLGGDSMGNIYVFA